MSYIRMRRPVSRCCIGWRYDQIVLSWELREAWAPGGEGTV